MDVCRKDERKGEERTSVRKSRKQAVRACSSRQTFYGAAVSGVKAQGRERHGEASAAPFPKGGVHAGRRWQRRLGVWLQLSEAGLTIEGIVVLRSPLRSAVMETKSSQVLLTREAGDTNLKSHSESCLSPLSSVSLCCFIYIREEGGKLVSRVSSLSLTGYF